MLNEIKEVTKRNFQKLLRELNPAEFPSIFQDKVLIGAREKLLRKEKLPFSEEQLSFFRLRKAVEDYKQQSNRYYVQQLDFSQFSHRPLLPFQEEGARFLLSNDRCILADDQGCGKTLETVIASMYLPENYKILVVTLKSLKFNFQKELSYYCDSYKVIEDKKWETGYKYTIVHYNSLKKWKKQIEDEKFDCIIGDESHVLINAKSARSTEFQKLTEYKSVKKLWLLTGTPITNRPLDYFNLLKLINHPLSKNWIKFVEQYCAGHKDYFGKWITNGSSNEHELYEKTKDVILRRLKKDHVKDLPNKDRQPIFLEMKNWKGYEQIIKQYEEVRWEELKEELGDLSDMITEKDIKPNAMTKLMLWRQFCALEKIRDGSLIELITNQLEQGNKIIVFTNFISVVDAVYDFFGDSIARKLDGRIGDVKKRLEIVDEFNDNDHLKIFVCNLQVGSTGLNIQSANVAIINDMFWVPGTMLQAEDRIWRIGQKRGVNILYPVYEKTVETIMYDVIDKKMKIISSIVEGKKESYFNTPELEKENNRKTILDEIFSQMG